MTLPVYGSAVWIRDEIDGRAEERPLRLEDAVAHLSDVDITISSAGKVKFTKDAISDAWKGTDSWLKLSGYNNQRYQEALDRYTMRRNVWTISMHRDCASSSYKDTSLVVGSGYFAVTDIISSNIDIKYANGSDTYTIGTAKSDWKIQSFHAEDNHNGDKSIVRMTIVYYTEWRLQEVDHA